MATDLDFLVRRDDLRQTRVEERGTPDLDPGQALLSIDAFALTANNVTYGVFGDALSYWDFFPAPDGWGRIPVWGFAEVTASSHDDVPEGARVYGYLPMSTDLVVSPDNAGERGFVDSAAHRAARAAVYNRYMRVDNDPRHEPRYEDHQMLMRPLFVTAFVLDDWLHANDFFGAANVVASSASSKTAIATAYLLHGREGVEVTGLTSAGNRGFVEGLGIYDAVATYDEIDSLPAARSVYVDFSGDAAIREAVHRHLGEALAHSSAVGFSHWEEFGERAEELPGPAPQMFFAPDLVKDRTREWGPQEFFSRVGDAQDRFVRWTDEWLEVVHGQGPDAVERVYRELLDGTVRPSTGHILSMS